MEHYKVTLSEPASAELQGIAGKGTHAASKVINALILLNCDQAGERTERPRTCDIAAMLCVSERKVDRIKKKFVLEGLDVTLNRQPSKCEYDLKIDGRAGGAVAGAELLDAARGPGPLVAATAGRPAGRVGIDRQRVARDGAPGA